jgi:hypothetical protein
MKYTVILGPGVSVSGRINTTLLPMAARSAALREARGGQPRFHKAHTDIHLHNISTMSPLDAARSQQRSLAANEAGHHGQGDASSHGPTAHSSRTYTEPLGSDELAKSKTSNQKPRPVDVVTPAHTEEMLQHGRRTMQTTRPSSTAPPHQRKSPAWLITSPSDRAGLGVEHAGATEA